MTCPLAVISHSLGKKSETFIYRHATELLPGKTAIAVRYEEPGRDGNGLKLPIHIIGQACTGWRYLYWSGRFALGLSDISPVQVGLLQFLRQHNVQVVLSEYLDISLKWLDVASKLGIRFYAHAHGYDVSRSLRDPEMRREYLRLKSADGIITMSEISRQRLIDLGLDESRIHVIPYGIDVSDSPVRHDVRKTDPVRCIAVGRMVAKKSPLLLLETFRRAVRAFPALRLDYIGEGELFEATTRFVQEHNLEANIFLHGGQPNTVVQTMMNRADIFLQHSRTDPDTGDEEGLPVAILEAMGHGLPVISTRHAGIPEAVVEGATGLLVDEGDAGGMADCLVQLARDAGLRGQFGQAGWQRAKARFTWQRERQDLLRVLGLEEQFGSNTEVRTA